MSRSALAGSLRTTCSLPCRSELAREPHSCRSMAYGGVGTARTLPAARMGGRKAGAFGWRMSAPHPALPATVSPAGRWDEFGRCVGGLRDGYGRGESDGVTCCDSRARSLLPPSPSLCTMRPSLPRGERAGVRGWVGAVRPAGQAIDGQCAYQPRLLCALRRPFTGRFRRSKLARESCRLVASSPPVVTRAAP